MVALKRAIHKTKSGWYGMPDHAVGVQAGEAIEHYLRKAVGVIRW